MLEKWFSNAHHFSNVLCSNVIFITMGRHKLNRTKEELQEQSRVRAKRFYERHSKQIKQERMRRYWSDKKLSEV